MTCYRQTLLSRLMSWAGLLLVWTVFLEPVLAVFGVELPAFMLLVACALIFGSNHFAHKIVLPKLPTSVIKSSGLLKYIFGLYVGGIIFVALAFFPVGSDVTGSLITAGLATAIFVFVRFLHQKYEKGYEAEVQKMEISKIF